MTRLIFDIFSIFKMIVFFFNIIGYYFVFQKREGKDNFLHARFLEEKYRK